PVLGVMLFSLILGEWVAPALQQKAQSDRALIMSGGQAISSEDGDWRKIGNQYIHINAIAPGGRELFGITVFELDDRRRLVRSSFAAEGHYIDEGTQPYWMLSDVEETRFTEGRLFAREHPQLEWQIDMSPELLSVLLV